MQRNNDNRVRATSMSLSTIAKTRKTPKTDFVSAIGNKLSGTFNGAPEAPQIPSGAIISAALANNSGEAAGAPGTGAPYGFTKQALSGGYGPAGGALPGVGAVPDPGGYGPDGVLSVPGRRASISPNLGQPPLGFAPGGFAGGGAAVGTSNLGVTNDAFGAMMGQMQNYTEFQASFNLQYLQLQEKIQQDTRQFNLISNIMKTKHEAAKTHSATSNRRTAHLNDQLGCIAESSSASSQPSSPLPPIAHANQ